MLKSARVERKTLTEIAEQELRHAIVLGTFRPGTQLSTEAELCQMLCFSCTVVRKGLRILEDDGLVARLLLVTVPDSVAEKLNLPLNALTLYIVQTNYPPDDEPWVYSREYHLPDAFDFIVWRRGSSRLQGSPSEAAK
jgi:DNA-binding GntR family transcriptional regulator